MTDFCFQKLVKYGLRTCHLYTVKSRRYPWFSLMVGNTVIITNTARKKALMSHYAGEEVDDIIGTLVIPAPTGDANKYTVFRDALNTHFLPQMNTEYAMYKFRTCAQEQGKTLDMYVTELKKFCNFQNLDRELKSQIIQNCHSTKLRMQSVENCNWTLKQVRDKGRAWNFPKARQVSSNAAKHRLMWQTTQLRY